MPDRPQRVANSSAGLKLKTWLVNQRLPLIGGPLRRSAAHDLAVSAQTGHPDAAQALLEAWLKASDPSWAETLAGMLWQIDHPSAITPFWEAWARTRNLFLKNWVCRAQKPAASTSPAYVLSLLTLNRIDALKKSGAEAIPDLVSALEDADLSLRQSSRQALLNLQREEAIRELCRLWLASRSPELAEIIAQAGFLPPSPPEITILIALKFNHPQVIAQAGADHIQTLLSARHDPDPSIAVRAAQGLLTLQNPSGVTALCDIWSKTRDPDLAELIVKSRYLASKPFPLRLLTALKIDRLGIAEAIAPSHLPVLLNLLDDADPHIAANARASLAHLALPETQTALCQVILENESPRLLDIAIQAGYAPSDPGQRALFFFLTRQWQAYDNFDYDHRHLRLLYTTAPTELRQRISRLVQQVGRTDYLNILAGVDLRQVSTAPEDAAILLNILTANREWEKLWNLVGWVDLPASIQIIRTLSQAGWKPNADGEDFERLAKLAAQKLITGGPELTQSLPPAVRRSVVKVNGRINDVNFHPSEPILAIGTSHPRLVLWDFQRAAVTRAIDGFDHAINLVVFGPNGHLFCGQRGKTQARCSIYLLKDGLASFLGGHSGSVTALLPVGQNFLLSTGRDQQIILWDTSTQQPVRQTQFEFWARSAAVSADQSTAALLHNGLNLLSLPDLTPLPYFARDSRDSLIRSGVARCAAFSPDGAELVVGQFNGQVIRQSVKSNGQWAVRRLLVTHPAPIEGLHFLAPRNLLITACGDGLIAFTEWPSGKPRGSLMMHTHRLTSLHVSPDGAFMATGGSEAAMVLWDLRILDIPRLFSTPVCQLSASQISVVASHAAAPEVPTPIRGALTALHILLQRHYRYDVQISEATTIHPGEFDILLQE